MRHELRSLLLLLLGVVASGETQAGELLMAGLSQASRPNVAMLVLPSLSLPGAEQNISNLQTVASEYYTAAFAGSLPEADQMPPITLRHIWLQHKILVMVMMLFMFIITLLIWILAYRNRQLRQSGEALKEAINSQKAILAAIPDLMFEFDQEGRYLDLWTKNPDELTASKATLLGHKVSEILPAEAAGQIMAAISEAEEQGQSHGQQIQLMTANGSLWFELSTSLKSRDVRPHRFIMLSRNVTERKQQQEELIISQERYRGLFENMANGVAIYRAIDNGNDFVFVDVNRAGESIEGVRREDLLGKKLSRVFPDIRETCLLEVFQRVWQSGKPENVPTALYSDNKLSSWRENFVYKLASGEIVAIFSDETAQKLAELNLQKSEKQKRLILDTVPDMVWLKDVDGRYLACNPTFERLFGAKEANIIGKTDYDFVEAGLAELFCRHDRAAMIADKPTINEEWVTFADNGQQVLLETTKTPFRADDGTVLGVLGIGHDVTEWKAAQDQLRLAASVFTHSQEGIIITDANNRIVDVNPACLQMTGYSREEMLGANPSLLSSDKQSQEFYDEMWKTLAESGHWQGEVINRRKSGEVYSEWLSIDTMYDEKGRLQHYVAVFSDITYIKEHKARLEQIAYNDALTGLPNRLLLRDRMQQALAQAKRHERLVAVCYLDLDGFKPINDSYGHKAGDQVLIEMGGRLQHAVRTGDTVARLGGDEFVLLMLDLYSIGELEQILGRLLQAVAQPFALPDENVTVSASIGIALHPLDDSEADTLLRHANQAMYVAKQQGKNRYSFFDPSEEKRATSAHSMQHEIRLAMAENQFCLFYQPKVNMRTGTVLGVEALIRWQHPHKGLLAPAEFLPAIEHSPLIVELGNWVFREALSQMRAWQGEGIDMQVSVNIAALQLQEPDFVSALKTLLGEFADVPVTHLELEILETAALHDIAHVSQIMTECSKLGIQFALDDFGTGYSSLTYLKNLPAKILKIDQSFVRNLLDDPEDIAITEGILGLARAFHRTPVAEGVETVQHGSLLLNLGCELGQGNGIAHPMPAEDLPAWLNSFQIAPEWRQALGSGQPDTDFSILVIAMEHHRMVGRVLSAIKQMTPSLLPDHLQNYHACQFGRWLDGEGRKHYGSLPEFSSMVDNHRRVHELFIQASENLANGESEALQSAATEIEELSNTILDSLNQLRYEV